MALDRAVPDPPDLTNRGTPRELQGQEETLGAVDFHREEIEELLQEGAWREGFDEWAEYTDLEEQQAGVVEELGLFRAFDFYWDPADDRLRFDAPTVPDDWRERDVTASFDSSTVSMIDATLQDLGRAVQEALEDYLERSDTVSAQTWIDEPYGHRDE